MEILPGLHQLKVPIPDNPLGYLNCYLLQGKDGWLMVDSGWPSDEAYRSLEAQLEAMGVALSQVSQIVVTHMHPDHYGLAGRVKQASSAQVAYHRKEKELLETRFNNPDQLQSQMHALLSANGVPAEGRGLFPVARGPGAGGTAIVWPDRVLEDGDEVSTGLFRLKVFLTPGHSPGHVCLYEPDKQLFFSGDHILPVITPNVSLSLFSGPNPLADFIHSLERLRQLPVHRVFPAHEHIFDDLAKRIDEIHHHHEVRAGLILAALEDGPLTAYEIASRVPWNIPNATWATMSPWDRRSATTETLAHLEFLRGEGKVASAPRDGLIYYRGA